MHASLPKPHMKVSERILITTFPNNRMLSTTETSGFGISVEEIRCKLDRGMYEASRS